MTETGRGRIKDQRHCLEVPAPFPAMDLMLVVTAGDKVGLELRPRGVDVDPSLASSPLAWHVAHPALAWTRHCQQLAAAVVASTLSTSCCKFCPSAARGVTTPLASSCLLLTTRLLRLVTTSCSLGFLLSSRFSVSRPNESIERQPVPGLSEATRLVASFVFASFRPSRYSPLTVQVTFRPFVLRFRIPSRYPAWLTRLPLANTSP
jgi:hypothetical protein